MRVGVLTSGGDAPGMNAAIRTVVKGAIARGWQAVGVRRGYEGLLAGDSVNLSLQDVDGISRYGGTLLGSARSKLFPTDVGQAQAREQVAAIGLDALVVIGGNGSLAGAHRLAEGRPCQIIGLPGSIDNDIGHTRLCIGVDTAVNTIVEACDRISDTARAHRRAFIVEVMGRRSGYLAMRAGLASDADAILFAERPMTEAQILDKLRTLIKRSFSPARDKKRVLILKAEAVEISTEALTEKLSAIMEHDCPGVDLRYTVLGHVVRGGSPSAQDRLIAQRLAMGALWAVEAGLHDVMVGWDNASDVGDPTPDPSARTVPLADVLTETALMLDGSSHRNRHRSALLEEAEKVLAL